MDNTLTQLGIGATLAILIIKMVLDFLKSRKNGNGHKTFADEPRVYWEQMKEVVTAPLAQVLAETNAVLRELRDRALREEGAAQANRKRR